MIVFKLYFLFVFRKVCVCSECAKTDASASGMKEKTLRNVLKLENIDVSKQELVAPNPVGGFVGVLFFYEVNDTTIQVEVMSVPESYRRRGYATKLMNYLVMTLFPNHVVRLTLSNILYEEGFCKLIV